jgi:hypothetical protein
VFAWGEYRYARWRNVANFCHDCWGDVFSSHARHLSPTVPMIFMARSGHSIPFWIEAIAQGRRSKLAA